MTTDDLPWQYWGRDRLRAAVAEGARRRGNLWRVVMALPTAVSPT